MMTGLNVLAKHTAHDVQPLVCMCVCVCHLWIILGSFLGLPWRHGTYGRNNRGFGMNRHTWNILKCYSTGHYKIACIHNELRVMQSL